MHFANLLISIFVFFSTASALPLLKRFYRPSSEVFSVIAHHKGGVFQYNLLKWDGQDLLLNADEQAFFGRVRASQGYVLNLPINGTYVNGTQTAAGTANVHVDAKTKKLTTTLNAANASHGFGITDSKLTYLNSTEFLACPDFSYRGQYSLYWAGDKNTTCPSNSRGYTVELMVQTDAYSNYNPSSNKPFGLLNSTVSADTTVANKKKRFYFF